MYPSPMPLESAKPKFLLLVLMSLALPLLCSIHTHASDDVDLTQYQYLARGDVKVNGIVIQYAIYKKRITRFNQTHEYVYRIWNGYNRVLRVSFIAGIGEGDDESKWQKVFHSGRETTKAESKSTISFIVPNELLHAEWDIHFYDAQLTKR